MKKLVIFDLDGTLLNTIEDITNSLNRALDSVFLPRVSIEDAKYFVGSGVDILIDRLIKFELNRCYNNVNNDGNYKFNYNKYYDKVKKFYLEDYAKNNAICTGPYPGIRDLIIKLKNKGIRVAVLSNKPHNDTLKVIDNYFGLDFFDLVMGKKENNRIKPYPDGANEVIETLQNRFSDRYKLSDIIYVGDTNVDIETAKNIGCDSIACTWGFRKVEEIQEASFIANNTDEVYDIITKKYDGVIVLNKHEGISSNKIINDIKHTLSKCKFPISKIGHAGTLDPLATGVMVVLVNNATKLSDYLMCEEKEYECEITFGSSYDTLDITGNLIKKVELSIDDYNNIKENINKCLESFKGESMQTPPMYSSIKQNGVKLYDLARNGETVEREKRLINIKDIKLISDVEFIDGEIKFSYKATVSKGTYIRSLCDDIGTYFNIPCAMSKLKRTRSGIFKIDDALTIDEIIEANNKNELKLISMKDAMSNIGLINVNVNEFLYNRVKHGLPIRIDENISKSQDEIGIVYNDELVAIYKFDINENNKDSYKVKLLWN